MKGRLLFWLLVVLVICSLLADAECKKKKKKHSHGHSKEKKKHSHGHSRGHSKHKSARWSNEDSDSTELGWKWTPQKNNWRNGWQWQTDIYRRPYNNRNGQGWWQWRGGNRPTTTTTTTTTTPAPSRWWNNNNGWQGAGRGWGDQWWVTRNGDQSGWWEDPNYWKTWGEGDHWSPDTSEGDWKWGDSDASDEWEDWENWKNWEDWENWKDLAGWENWDWEDWEDWSPEDSSSGSKGHKSKKSHNHSHKSKKHSHGSKHSKHSHGSKKHSHGSHSSGGSSDESDESGKWIEIVIIDARNRTGIDMSWCRNWCRSFVRQNFWKLYPSRESWPYNSRRRPSNWNINRVCNDFIEEHGHYCNTTGSVTPAPTVTTTDRTGRDYSCTRADDCYYDECCVAHGDIGNSTCVKLSQRNDECSRPEELHNNETGVYWESCPCTYGYECINKWEYIIRKSPASFINLLKDQEPRLGGEKKCKPAQNMTVTTTTAQPVVTMLPPVERTTPEGYTVVWNNTDGGQVTQPPTRLCRSHLDCDFFQCCTHDDDDTPEVGECSNFSQSGDFCSSLSDLTVTSKLDHCPCQSFLQCKGYTRGQSDLVYYRCG